MIFHFTFSLLPSGRKIDYRGLGSYQHVCLTSSILTAQPPFFSILTTLPKESHNGDSVNSFSVTPNVSPYERNWWVDISLPSTVVHQISNQWRTLHWHCCSSLHTITTVVRHGLEGVILIFPFSLDALSLSVPRTVFPSREERSFQSGAALCSSFSIPLPQFELSYDFNQRSRGQKVRWWNYQLFRQTIPWTTLWP